MEKKGDKNVRHSEALKGKPKKGLYSTVKTGKGEMKSCSESGSEVPP